MIEDIQQRSMPESVREPFEVLWQEVVHLHCRWKMFKQLYFNNRVVELLNKHASGFFGLDQRIWVESIVLGLSRVLDDTRGSTTSVTYVTPFVAPREFGRYHDAWKDWITARLYALKGNRSAAPKHPRS